MDSPQLFSFSGEVSEESCFGAIGIGDSTTVMAETARKFGEAKALSKGCFPLTGCHTLVVLGDPPFLEAQKLK